MTETPDLARSLAALSTVHLTILHWQKKLAPAVVDARKRGATWQQVGECFGKGRQYAWEAFHELPGTETDPALPEVDDDAPTA